MKMLLLTAGLLAATPRPGDYHTSILNIHHDPVEHDLSLTWRMSTHDVGDAILAVTDQDLQLGSANELPGADSLLKHYLLQHLQLSFGDSAIHLTYIGKQVEKEDLLCYLKVDNVDSAEGLTVSCDLLQDLFADQVNQVNVGTAEGTESHPFTSGSGGFQFGMQDK
ncbi:MAG: hypothetical protein QM724_10835 [Flavobacteriales bacterium]